MDDIITKHVSVNPDTSINRNYNYGPEADLFLVHFPLYLQKSGGGIL